ncbi:MAG: threonyl-tRNA synthetase editing domain-containing protein [Candidatus Micrarchaeia archaeon]
MAWHVDYFKAKPQEKGRSTVSEEASSVETATALLVFLSFEKSDESRGLEASVEEGAREIRKIAGNVGVDTIILNPFAHMFAELSSENFARSGINALYDSLSKEYKVSKLAFGWFYEIELKAKGHRFARVSRIV